MSDQSTIFCCPFALLTTVATYRTRKESALWYFAGCMSGLISRPSNTPLSNTPSSSSPSPLPAGFCAHILNESPFVVQFEKWVEGEMEEKRIFAQYPETDHKFIEMEAGTVKMACWVWGWSHIKLRCEHKHTMFVLKYLEKYDRGEEERRGFMKINREVHVEGEDKDEKGSWDGGEEATEASFQGGSDDAQLNGEGDNSSEKDGVKNNDIRLK